MKKDPGVVGTQGELVKGAMLSDRISFQVSSALGSPEDWIEVMSWSWGETAGVAINPNGQEFSWPTMTEFHFTKHLDANSPKLALYLAQNRDLNKVTFREVVLDRQGKETKYLEITMSDVHVTSLQIAGHSSGHELPMEEVSLSFEKFEFNYIGPDPSLAGGFVCDPSKDACGAT